MKRTFTINLSGMVFNIDDDAYELLQNYLESLSNSFSDKEEGQEVMADIEARIVELFQDRLGSNREVVSIHDVEYIIEVLGKPEDFDATEAESENYGERKYDKHSGKQQWKTGKRLYRDIDESVLGGVSSGIAAFFGVSVVIIRILFLLSFFFFGPLLYIILWIVVPAARTAAQKLEMRGEPVNVENIEKQVKAEYENVKSNFRNFKKKNGGRFEEGIQEFVNVFLSIGKPIGRILAFVLAIIVFVFVITIVFRLFGHLWAGDLLNIDFIHHFQGLPFPAFLDLAIQPDNIDLLTIGILLVVAVPVVAILIGIINVLLGWGRLRFISGLLGLSLLVGIALIVYIFLVEGTHFKGNGKVIEQHSFTLPANDSIRIMVSSNPYGECSGKDFEDDCNYYYDWKNYKIINDDFRIVANNGELELSISPDVVVRRGGTDSVVVMVKKQSLGDDMNSAKNNANELNYNWKFDNGILKLDPYFILTNEQKWRNQDIEVVISVPDKVALTIDERADFLVKNNY